MPDFDAIARRIPWSIKWTEDEFAKAIREALIAIYNEALDIGAAAALEQAPQDRAYRLAADAVLAKKVVPLSAPTG